MERRRLMMYSNISNLSLTPFVAPIDFDVNTQPVNLVTIFNSNPNPNKAYICSIIDDYENVYGIDFELIQQDGIIYQYGYTRDGIDYIYGVEYTNQAFSIGDINRWILVINNNDIDIGCVIFNGCVWCIVGDRCTNIGCFGSNYSLLYIHIIGTSQLTTINDAGFYDCINLTGELNIPNSVSYIGSQAFFNCYNLIGSLTIPSYVSYIGGLCFGDCIGLDGSLILSSQTIDFQINPFYNTNLILSDMLVNNFEIYDKILYGDIDRTLLIGTTLNKIGSLTIPNTVINIGEYAFYNCMGLTGSLTIPSSIASCGVYCFANCTGFDGTLTLSPNCSILADNMFINCSGFIGDLTIPSGVINILNNAFNGCSGFSDSLNIPNTIKNNSIFQLPGIGVGVFDGCDGLIKLNLASGYNPQYSINNNNYKFNYTNNLVANNLNISIINITTGTKTLTIGNINKTRLTAAYSNAVANAAARGITII